ncbi:predicted protein [Nematostella vectensis]|uniref:Uncharacterized protein n=1 Tax=Nematostella vectensis TaxID=45351 RepID=A7TB36_NEMVE|nr:predicted protein [Nematostella vectensis]|eukprot:XP_001618881.1 hypothetical protein NEMVEDRAFT_v1g224732 [Nematostella vectensis]
MGIRGLSSYIETLDVWEKIELKDTKVVIDGSCLVFNLYEGQAVIGKSKSKSKNSGLDFRNGGEYYEFAQVVSSFFQALSSNNVEAYVVLDGAIDPSGRKVDTIESRMQDSINNAGKPYGRVMPKMSALVLSQAMRDIGVKFVRIDWLGWFSRKETETTTTRNIWIMKAWYQSRRVGSTKCIQV